MSWSAKQYSTFEAERTRPVRDLVAAIATESVQVVVDLGCGPGNSTEVLARRFPEARVTGMDSSEEMLASARQRLPELNFEQADIATWDPEQAFDVILANASLQWLEDHATLYPHLVSKLVAGGTLAVQTPDNMQEPSHRLAREVAAHGPWTAKIGAVRHPPRHDATFYYELLRRHCATVDVWCTTYHHPLAGGHAAVVEWFKGSALRPYLALLDEAEKTAYLQRYLAAISEAYPASVDGTVLLPFPRLFVVAMR
ncbi:trans-aconitate 2-methyltransferase [Pseudomonas agarici]|uniref:trans-aconitate 2-methyltransferase n=1 Tax=Pseudomonas agarici TaxID=46677 RepID=UPI0015A408DB|nr:trans-aconitate 2-methyltransferase [Pseudomonas agarici]NWB93039.1 trans-aconitate 2-methyltransferase [Pseudomonas agarici]